MKPNSQYLKMRGLKIVASFGREAYKIIAPSGQELLIGVSDGLGWDHVSVSTPDRCPTWDEMCFVKGIFWHDEEVVVQYHPCVNNHPFVLHLWKPQLEKLPTPNALMVGVV